MGRRVLAPPTQGFDEDSIVVVVVLLLVQLILSFIVILLVSLALFPSSSHVFPSSYDDSCDAVL